MDESARSQSAPFASRIAMHRVVALTALAWGLGHSLAPDLRAETARTTMEPLGRCAEPPTTPLRLRLATDRNEPAATSTAAD